MEFDRLLLCIIRTPVPPVPPPPYMTYSSDVYPSAAII